LKKEKINCFNCIHFFITWDDKFPRGCRAMDFKTRKMPSVAVYDASGMPCVRFKAKQQKPQ
jgi:hypothetical protein